MNEDYLVASGGALKSLSDSGKIGGHLVLFGPHNVDLDNEYFSSACDFWLEGKSFIPAIYDHGRSQTFRKNKLTHVRFEKQHEGLWIEGKLPIRESAAIEALWESIKRDELGWSSGTSGHLAERIPRGDVTEIVTWPITEASLARRPAQPRSRAVALKSIELVEFEYTPRHELQSETNYYEQRAAQIYADLLMSQHERRMRELSG